MDGEFMLDYEQNDLLSSFKLEELVRTFEEGEVSQCGVLICNSLIRRQKQFGGWYLESVQAGQKGMLEEEVEQFYQRLSEFVVVEWESSIS